MPDDGTRVVYSTVISTYPGMMSDPIALGVLKQYWVVVLSGFIALTVLPSVGTLVARVYRDDGSWHLADIVNLPNAGFAPAIAGKRMHTRVVFKR